MQVDVSFDEFGLLLQAVNNLNMQAQSVSEIAAFEHLLAKLSKRLTQFPSHPTRAMKRRSFSTSRGIPETIDL
jgi:predicted metal-dependent hydrolase